MREANPLSFPLLLRVLDRATRTPVLTGYALLQAAALAAIVLAYGYTMAGRAEGPPGLGPGDFAAFYTGAVLIGEGRGEDLYDFPAQRTVQDRIRGGAGQEWQPYLNPPLLAIGLAAATRLGYRPAFLLFTLTLLVSLAGALWYALRALPGITRFRGGALTASLLILGWLPVALTTFGGQNTSLSLALMTLFFAAWRQGYPGLAGLALGLLTFKPQYAWFLGVLLLARGQWKVLLVAAVVGVLHYGIGAVACGPAWPIHYVSAMRSHGPVEMAQNGLWHFSLPALASQLLGPKAVWPALAVSGLAVVVLAMLGRRIPAASAAFPAFAGWALTSTLLVSPHLQYYEAGLLSLPVLLAVETCLEQGRSPTVLARGLLALGYFSFPAWRLGRVVGIQPLFVPLLLVWAWTGVLARNKAKGSAAEEAQRENPCLSTRRSAP